MSKVDIVGIDSITLDPENARKRTDPNREAIKKSLARFGPGRSVVTPCRACSAVVVARDARACPGCGAPWPAHTMWTRPRSLTGCLVPLVLILATVFLWKSMC